VAEPSHPAAGAEDSAGERGSLELAPRVVTRIAELSALQVAHVVRRSDGIERLVGRRLPRASASLDRDRVRIEVDVAVQWPCPVEEVAAQVRHHVAAETARLTGLMVRSTVVTVHAVTRESTPQQPPRRVQ
jgi:uncharacterized alkaline shock family protein YloU